ncbi:lipopolysaccharide biosynthesis protein [Sphingobacterium litopenaei]|uniref:Lipopolysaccharide biosynthesis protein n=1 Tax=Sphingobacterium litopenaei TaxID=2763500 RepID=A0ABR7YER6_9SPHI|nr:lipopolysaccharide biosynthesis protein [Sphingobacterium litopenaei]MBD1429805.1 lipopolysaccharide biosynthesis protein [Sphingobacterium litopenaei]
MSSNSSDSLKSKAVKGILWGSISNGAQQLLAVFFGIYLGRILTPHDYGLVSLIIVFATVCSSIQEAGFINALANRKEVDHRDYNAVFWMSLMISITLYILLFAISPLIGRFYNQPELVPAARVLFIGLIFGSLGISHSAYLFKTLKVKERSLATALGTLCSGVVGISLVYLGYAYWGIVFQTITYSFTFSLICFLYSDFRPTLQINFAPIKELWGFSSKILLTRVVEILNNNILTLILGKNSTTSTGNYTQANGWSIKAQGVIANMSHGFAQPMLSTIADDEDRQKRIFTKLLNFICFAAFPTLALLNCVAEEFILITVKEKWLPAVPILKILCINAAFLPIINFYSNFLLSKGKSDLYMRYIISFGVIQLIIIYFLHGDDVLPMVWGISLFTMFWTFIWQLSVAAYSKIKYAELSLIITKYLITALLAGALTYFIGNFVEGNWVSLIVKTLVFGITYISILYVAKSEVLLEIIHYLKNKYVSKHTDN